MRWNKLTEVCTELLAEDWARENISKLLGQRADERHLFPFARSYKNGNYFYRLSDSYEDEATEELNDVELPEGLTDVWFRGRARRDIESDITELQVARFHRGPGWHRYAVRIEEQSLPSPNPSIVEDREPAADGTPRNRSL